MLDVEFISELVVAVLHGVQEEKKKLDEFYQRYEEAFPERDCITEVFQKTTGEIVSILPNLRATRWRRKSDFYSLFLVLANHVSTFPLPRESRDSARERLEEFAASVDEFLKIDLDNPQAVDEWPAHVARFGVAVERAASDPWRVVELAIKCWKNC